MRKKLTPEELALLTPIFGYDISGGSGESAPAPSRMADPIQYIQELGGDMGALYSPEGEWLGDDRLNTGTPGDLLKQGILASLMMYGGAQGLSGLMGGGAPAGGLAPFSGMGGTDIASIMGGGEAAAAGLGGLPAVSSALPSLSPIGQMSMPSLGTVANVAGAGGAGAGLLGRVVGAALGAASSQDRTDTKTSEPWGPAQDWIKQNIAQGQQLQKQYTDQPFSPTQQTAYNNLGGLLNTINQGAGGLHQGFGAAASGANNFDRSDPRKKLTGSNFSLGNYLPGLLQFFGGK